MTKGINNILVLTDYTIASGIAAQHAYQLAELAKAEVLSLHTITNQGDLQWAIAKSTEQIEKLPNYNEKIKHHPLVLQLDLFNGLDKLLVERNVQLNFMATHGKKDMQFLTGSNALKLIRNAKSPFLIVQQNSPVRPYSHVVLPVFAEYYKIEFSETLLQSLLKLFRAKITFVIPADTDKSDSSTLNQAVQRLSAILANNATEVQLKKTELSGKKFQTEVLQFSTDSKADAIAVITGYSNQQDFASKNKSFFQSLITNEVGLPVLCL
jgi:nucleotide-binding universal stress UspA family protein